MRIAKRRMFSRHAVPALGLALATAAIAQTGQAPSQQQGAPAQARPPAQTAEQEEPIPFPFGAVEDKAAVKAAAEALVPVVEASDAASKQYAACYLKKLAMGSDDRLIEWTVLCPSDSDDRTSGVCSSTAFPESQLAAQLTASGDVDTVDATHHFLSRLSAYAMNLDRGRRGGASGAEIASELDRIARSMSVARRRIGELASGAPGVDEALSHYEVLDQWIARRSADPGSIYACGTAESGPVTTRSADSHADVVLGAGDVRARAREAGSVRVVARVVPQVRSRSGEVSSRDVEMAQDSVVVSMRDAGAPVGEPIEDTDLVVLQVDAAQLDQLLASGRVDVIAEDIELLPSLAQSAPLVDAPGAWALPARGDGQVVAILDTGIDKTHPFLTDKVVAEACFGTTVPPPVPPNPNLRLRNSACPGGAATARGEGTGAPCTANGCNHGTHVAGIVAGKNDTQSGIAPDAKLISIQVFSLITDQGTDTPCANRVPSEAPTCTTALFTDLVRGLNEVRRLSRDHKIVAANMSLNASARFPGACNALDAMMQGVIRRLLEAGIATVISSGNQRFTDGTTFPACVTDSIAVGSVDKSDVIAASSNSSSAVDLMAPGVSINSSVPGGGFANFNGTSMAAPHVAGALAVLRSHKNDARVISMQNALRLTGKPITDGRPTCGDLDGDGNPDCVRSGFIKPRIDVKKAVDVIALTNGRNEEGDAFGFAVASGDFDHDGKADLAVGAAGENIEPGSIDAGYVFLFKGDANGLKPWGGIDQQGLDANENGDRFGSALVVGDFDGDGRHDLAVGAPGETVGTAASGAVYVFKGASGGLQAARRLDQVLGGLGVNEAGDRFGAALAAADLNADGKDDLAVGAPGEAPGTGPRSGIVFLFSGGIALEAWQTLDQQGLDSAGNEFGDEFGAALAAGDFDNDLRQDLAVGAPGDSTGGRVFVFRGTSTAPQPWADAQQEGFTTIGPGAGTESHTEMSGTPGSVSQNGDRFGSALAAGDFDHDGDDDLAVGAPGEATGTRRSGAVFLLSGGNSRLAPPVAIVQAPAGADESGDNFGAWLDTGDFNGDRKDDLAVGAPGARRPGQQRGGLTFVLRGGGPTFAMQAPPLAQGDQGVDETGDRFGQSLESGDFNGDGVGDLAVGAPGEAPGPDPRSGFVYLFYGSATTAPVGREGLGQGS